MTSFDVEMFQMCMHIYEQRKAGNFQYFPECTKQFEDKEKFAEAVFQHGKEMCAMVI